MRLFGLFCIHVAMHCFIVCGSIWIQIPWVWNWIDLFVLFWEKKKKFVFGPRSQHGPFSFFLSRRPNSLLPAQSVSLASPSRGRCHVGPARQGFPFLVPSRDSPPSLGAARAGAAFLARTPRPLAAPYLRCRGPRLGSLRARAALSSKPCAAARAAWPTAAVGSQSKGPD